MQPRLHGNRAVVAGGAWGGPTMPLAAFLRAVSLDPDHLDALVNLVNHARGMGRSMRRWRRAANHGMSRLSLPSGTIWEICLAKRAKPIRHRSISPGAFTRSASGRRRITTWPTSIRKGDCRPLSARTGGRCDQA